MESVELAESPADYLIADFDTSGHGTPFPGYWRRGFFSIKDDMDGCFCEHSPESPRYGCCSVDGRTVTRYSFAPACEQCYVRYNRFNGTSVCGHSPSDEYLKDWLCLDS